MDTDTSQGESSSGINTSGGEGGDPLFEPSHPIFANRDILRIGHVPEADRIVGRNEEIQKLGKRLNGAVQGYSPDHVVIYGKTGTGKSLVSKHVCQRAKNAAKDGNEIGTAYVDCAEDDTETRAIATLASKFNKEDKTGESVPHTGLSTSGYYKLFWKIIDQQYDSILIILDEIDMMDNSEILMKLSRAEEAEKTECSIGVIAISNKIQYIENLENERIKSSFRHKKLLFKPYDAGQLEKIMNNRRDAFHDGVLSDDVIPLSAEYAAQEHGDARKAIDILRYGGDIAYEAGAETVEKHHVQKARERADQSRVSELVSGSTPQAKAALLAICEMDKNSDADSFQTDRVYDKYQEICENVNLNPLSVRRFRDIIKEQSFLDLVEIQKVNKGSSGGIVLEYRLVDDHTAIRQAILDDHSDQEWPDNQLP